MDDHCLMLAGGSVKASTDLDAEVERKLNVIAKVAFASDPLHELALPLRTRLRRAPAEGQGNGSLGSSQTRERSRKRHVHGPKPPSELPDHRERMG